MVICTHSAPLHLCLYLSVRCLWEFYIHAMPHHSIALFKMLFSFLSFLFIDARKRISAQILSINSCLFAYVYLLEEYWTYQQKQEISNYFCMQITWPLPDPILCTCTWTLDLRFHNKIIKLIHCEYAFPCGRSIFATEYTLVMGVIWESLK